MKILYLGHTNCKLLHFLKHNNDIVVFNDKLTLDYCKSSNFEIIISYGYRYIIPKIIIDYFKNKIINLHISYLPFNRGAMPNIWSIIDNTKKGVSIHYIDEGVDTGEILYQQEVEIQDHETLQESYDKLNNIIQELSIVTGKHPFLNYR